MFLSAGNIFSQYGLASDAGSWVNTHNLNGAAFKVKPKFVAFLRDRSVMAKRRENL